MTVGEMSPHPSALPLLTPGMFLRTLRAKRSCTRRRVTVFSMSLRTSVHTGVAIRFPRREAWQVGCCLGKFVTLSRIRLRRCFLLCATAGEADCPVAPLLAMTCRNMQLPAVATAWCHGKFVTPYVCALSAAILLCPTAGEADCHVAPLLAMTCCNMHLPAWQGRFPSGKFVALFRIPQASPPLQPRTPTRLQHVIANQCAHWCGNPRPRRETWQIGATSGKSAAPLVFARSTTFCCALPQGVRIVPSLRSSQ